MTETLNVTYDEWMDNVRKLAAMHEDDVNLIEAELAVLQTSHALFTAVLENARKKGADL